jgi:hypothetical protein
MNGRFITPICIYSVCLSSHIEVSDVPGPGGTMYVQVKNVHRQPAIAQIRENPGSRELNVPAEGQDDRDGLRVWKEPHERKLDIVGCFCGQMCQYRMVVPRFRDVRTGRRWLNDVQGPKTEYEQSLGLSIRPSAHPNSVSDYYQINNYFDRWSIQSTLAKLCRGSCRTVAVECLKRCSWE